MQILALNALKTCYCCIFLNHFPHKHGGGGVRGKGKVAREVSEVGGEGRGEAAKWQGLWWGFERGLRKRGREGYVREIVGQ